MKKTGFTLIEMIGVLAIMSVLAAIIAPDVIRQLASMEAVAESENLDGLATVLEQSILHTKKIPAEKDWVEALANEMAVTPDQIEKNARGFKRKYFVDPEFLKKDDSKFQGYTQEKGLDEAPASPRIMILSNLREPISLSGNKTRIFSEIWDQSEDNPFTESRSKKVKRIHLRHLFHRVILTNKKDKAAAYQLESEKKQKVPNTESISEDGMTRYLIHNTRLNLFLDPYPKGKLNHVLLISADDSFMYGSDGEQWYWGRP